MKDGEVYYECVPEGGEGMEEYKEKARMGGDWDYGGYCGRSIGVSVVDVVIVVIDVMLLMHVNVCDCTAFKCMEIGTPQQLNEKFRDLVPLDTTEYYRDIIQGDTNNPSPFLAVTGGKMVALPRPHSLDVGLARDEWPLPAKQYADAAVTLRFPVGPEDILETLLSSEFRDPKAFGISANRKAVSKTLFENFAESFANMQSGGRPETGGETTEVRESADSSAADSFALDGVDLFDAKIERKKLTRDAIDTIGRRYLRAASRRVQEEEVIEVTYTLTAQGSYRVSCA